MCILLLFYSYGVCILALMDALGLLTLLCGACVLISRNLCPKVGLLVHYGSQVNARARLEQGLEEEG